MIFDNQILRESTDFHGLGVAQSKVAVPGGMHSGSRLKPRRTRALRPALRSFLRPALLAARPAAQPALQPGQHGTAARSRIGTQRRPTTSRLSHVLFVSKKSVRLRLSEERLKKPSGLGSRLECNATFTARATTVRTAAQSS